MLNQFTSRYDNKGAKIAKLVKAWICNLRIAGSSLTACGVFFWYGPLESPSLQIASVASDHHGKNNGGRNRWIRSEIIPWLLKIHLSLHDKSSQISAGDVQT